MQKRIALMVDAELAQELKVYAVTHQTTMKKIIEELITKLLTKNEK